MGEGYSRAIESNSLSIGKNSDLAELLENQRKQKLLDLSKSPVAKEHEYLSPRDGKFSKTS